MKANTPEKLYIDLFKGEFNVSYSPTNNKVISRKGCVTMGMLIEDFIKAMEI